MQTTEDVGVFRVFPSDSDVHVGVGFLLVDEKDDKLTVAFTCAHVVALALGEGSVADSPSTPFAKFKVDFPNSDSGEFYDARVKAGVAHWHPKSDTSSGRSQPQDIAVLEIAVPVERLRDMALCAFEGDFLQPDLMARAFGGLSRTKGEERRSGRWVPCKVSFGAHGFLQVDAENAGDTKAGRFIEKGFSGGPLIEVHTKQVLGMVSRVNEMADYASITPLSELQAALNIVPFSEGEEKASELPIPFDLRLPDFDSQFPRPNILSAIKSVTQKGYLTYIHGPAESGKSSALLSFILHETTPVDPTRVIWYPCHSDMTYNHMVDSFSKVVFDRKAEDLTPRSLFRLLHEESAYLVIDGLQHAASPGFKTLLEIAAKSPAPSRLFVTTTMEPNESYLMRCAAHVGYVERADILSFVSSSKPELAKILPEKLSKNKYSALELKQVVNLEPEGGVDNIQYSDNGYLFDADLLEGFSPVQRVFVSILSQVQNPISLPAIRVVAEQVGLGHHDLLVSELLDRGLIKNFSTNRFIFQALPSEVLDRLGGHKDKRKFEGILAKAYEASVYGARKAGGRWTSGQLADLVSSIQHYQNSSKSWGQRKRLIGKGIRPLARTGQHGTLIGLLEKEIELRPENTDVWWRLQLAQSYVAIGDVRGAFYSLKDTYSATVGTKDLSGGALLNFCYRLADTVVQSNRPDLGYRLLNSVLGKLDQSKLELTSLSMAVSLMEWCKSTQGVKPNFERLHQMLSDAEMTGKPIAVGVQATRLGVEYFRDGAIPTSLELLERGISAFRGSDVRGLMWALSSYCYALCCSGQQMIARQKLPELIDLFERFELYGEDTFFQFQEFSVALKGDLLHDRCIAILDSAKDRAKRRELGPFDLEFFDALEASLVETIGSEGEASQFGETEGLLGHVSKLEVNSNLSRSLIENYLRTNPLDTISALFDQQGPVRMFSVPLYCRLVTECGLRLKDEAFTKGFVLPYLDLIEGGEDWVKLHYAIYFERMGDDKRSQSLLECVQNKSTFAYMNTAANCYTKSNPQLAYDLNLSALKAAKTPARRSRILNNLCVQILRFGWVTSYDDARIFIDESISLKPEHFYWPERTELALNIETGSEPVSDLCDHFLESGRMSDRAAKHVSSLVSKPGRKMEFLNWFEEYQRRAVGSTTPSV